MEKTTFPQWVIDVATITSILSFIITIFVFKQVGDIRKKFSNKARLPEIQNELIGFISNINSQIDDWENSKEKISVEFSNCAGLLDSLAPKLNGVQGIKAKKLLKKLRYKPYYIFPVKKKEINNMEIAWSLYEDLSELNVSLSQVIKDSNWE